ncbi:MAG: CBS domain-containing protein [Rhodospirillales bacterium]|nr:CBS domain-containing protein [Rhodospirillales bacterium]
MTIENVLRGKDGSIVTVSPRENVETAAQLLNEHCIGAILAMEGDNIAGVLSERDIVRSIAKMGAAALSKPVASLMTAKVITCTKTDTVQDVMGLMTDKRIRHVPVIENGTLIGIVSIGDLVKERIAQSEHEASALRDYISAG